MDNNTEKFLEHFPGHHIFVAMPEFNGAPWHLHDGYRSAEKTLQDQNKEGWGIFFTVNELDESLDEGKHRTAKMVTRCRAVFMDDDIPRDKPREDFPLNPSLIVNSSPGKYHYYWLTSTEDKDTWRMVQNGIINRYDGDKNAKDLSRYLRLPGYNHNKKDAHEVCWEGDGEVYEWSEILKNFSPEDIGRTDVTNLKRDDQDSKPVTLAEQEIIQGKNYHENILSLTYQLKQEGVQRRYIILTIQGLMNQVPEKKRDQRWYSRYDDIERLVDGAVQENVSVDEIDIPDEEKFESPIPWPPALLGQLAQDAYDMQRFQYREVAVVSALGLVAGITGRRFNILGTGLNLYLTLIMSTGMGKDSISEFINGTLISLNDVGTASSFCGPARFTGPKSVIKSLENARSQVCVFTEAGLLLKSKAGDKEGLSRVLLSLYGKSGAGSVSGAEAFSKEEESLKMLRSPSLTIVNEATPETLLEAFKDGQALERGELPRQSIYRITGDKPYMNFNAASATLSQSSVQRLKHLIKLCSVVQAGDDPQAYPMIPTPEVQRMMQEASEEYIDLENTHRGEDSIRSIMASRAFVKAMKFSAIASVFNHTDAIVNEEEWKWGKAMVDYEINGIENFFQGGQFGNSYDDIIIRIVGKAIVKLLKREYKGKKTQISKQDAQRGQFPLYALTQALGSNKELQSMNDDMSRFNPKTGLEKMIDFMVRIGYLRIVTNDNRKVYKITQAFMTLYKLKSHNNGMAEVDEKGRYI